ncbi:hypothetical protein Taro_010535 [Colocasia esculenta]|uniref:RING-type E3 ubiquitin transferase n=1 Tax=Colocasia esculenta TaxID=4460 RepID=A0A843U7U1_COLES|nr:hypothetical protein [Colocasia esculenta]
MEGPPPLVRSGSADLIRFGRSRTDPWILEPWSVQQVHDLDKELREKDCLINSLRSELEGSRQKKRDEQKQLEALGMKMDRLENQVKIVLEESRAKSEQLNHLKRRITDLQRDEEQPRNNSEGQCLQFSYAELQQATNGFEVSKKIGEGGYGSVYKGFLRHTIVAIKKLGSQSMQGLPEFHQEVKILAKVRHQNLVNLMGACSSPEPCLVYEFLPNGSLADRLSCQNGSSPLGWQARIRIATEICSALIFLHSHKPNSVVHGDLNPSNILLDGNFVAKLSDFGLCCLLPQSSDTTVLHHTEPRGTFAYIDPEFMSSGTLTTSSDTYSFGVIILQLLTGERALGLIKIVNDALESDNLQDILDKSAREWPYLCAKRLARLGIECCSPDRETRAKLETHVWRELVNMLKASSLESSSFQLKQEDESHAPSYFFCPILQEVMIDPQVAADGFTYEAAAIKAWLDSGRNTSPMTNVELPHPGLLPNLALRSQIKPIIRLLSYNLQVNILAKVRHQNLVSLMGACSSPEPCLVYEFLPNGSLADQLSCKNGSSPLSWQARIRIATEICSALIFLHSHKPYSVVHGDLNPSNILLDRNFVAKLGDFGLCRLLPLSNATTMLHHTELRGTFAYLDPEYTSNGTLTTSSDTYSFGVIILQLLTGVRALGLVKKVKDVLESDNLQDILDKSAGEWPYLWAKRLARLGIECCSPDRETRAKLETHVWRELVNMLKASSLESSSFQLKQEDESHAPSYFFCPILQEVMIDPQVAADGFTYEAAAIKSWLDCGHNTSPMTNLELPHPGLLPNHALRSVIQEWRQRQLRRQATKRSHLVVVQVMIIPDSHMEKREINKKR